MSLDTALSAGRMAAESRMLSTAIIRRKTGAMVVGPDGLEVPGWTSSTPVPCRIGGMSRGQSGSRTLSVGGTEFQVATRIAHLPHGTDLRDNDLIAVTGESAGVYRVVEADPADQQTALRVPVVAAEPPKEW